LGSQYVDLPDLELESELYQKILTYQIHRYDPLKCSSPTPPGKQYKKGFLKQFSNITYIDQNSNKYIYKYIKLSDQWVVNHLNG